MFDGDQGGLLVNTRDQKPSHRQFGIHDIRSVVLPITVRDAIQATDSGTKGNLETLG
jgi:hypothetical protein